MNVSYHVHYRVGNRRSYYFQTCILTYISNLPHLPVQTQFQIQWIFRTICTRYSTKGDIDYVTDQILKEQTKRIKELVRSEKGDHSWDDKRLKVAEI